MVRHFPILENSETELSVDPRNGRRNNTTRSALYQTNKEKLVFNVIRLKSVLNYNVSFLFCSLFVLTRPVGDICKQAHALAAPTSN